MCVDAIVLVPASFLDSLYCSHFQLQQTVLNVSYRVPSQMKKGTPIFLLSGIKECKHFVIIQASTMHQQTMHVMNIPLFFLSLLAALPLVAL